MVGGTVRERYGVSVRLCIIDRTVRRDGFFLFFSDRDMKLRWGGKKRSSFCVSLSVFFTFPVTRTYNEVFPSFTLL